MTGSYLFLPSESVKFVKALELLFPMHRIFRIINIHSHNDVMSIMFYNCHIASNKDPQKDKTQWSQDMLP